MGSTKQAIEQREKNISEKLKRKMKSYITTI